MVVRVRTTERRTAMTLRIEYDDDAITIMEKVNEVLLETLPTPIQFVSDDKEHDGFEEYELTFLRSEFK